MRRRQLLAGGAALLPVPLAGCAHPPNVLDMSEATDQDIADEGARSPSPESDEQAIIAEAAPNGTANVTGRSPPLETDRPVAFEGRYYNVSVTRLGESESTRYAAEIEIDYDPGTVTPADGSIAYESLPDVDREALGDMIPPAEDRPTGDGYDFGRGYTYPENATDESVLIPEQQYDVVTYEGEQYRIRVQSEPADESEYRYDVSLVADTTAAFADLLRERYLFELSGLSEAEREVVETAIEDGYFEDATDAFRSVVARLLAHPGFEVTDSYGRWLVEYEDTEYITYAEYPTEITPRG
jgi:hypothetical protein